MATMQQRNRLKQIDKKKRKLKWWKHLLFNMWVKGNEIFEVWNLLVFIERCSVSWWIKRWILLIFYLSRPTLQPVGIFPDRHESFLTGTDILKLFPMLYSFWYSWQTVMLNHYETLFCWDNVTLKLTDNIHKIYLYINEFY
jgi:hypothetical protein